MRACQFATKYEQRLSGNESKSPLGQVPGGLLQYFLKVQTPKEAVYEHGACGVRFQCANETFPDNVGGDSEHTGSRLRGE